MIGGSRLRALLAWLSLAAGPVCAAVDGSRPSYDSYGSYQWLLACDNGLRCAAKGLQPVYQGSDLLIEREAGPGGAIRVRIAAAFPFTVDDLQLDGESLELDPHDWTLETRDGVTRLSTGWQAVARAFIARIRYGQNLEFATRENSEIPLNGLTAALLRMDDRQGRIGTVTALARPGGKPARSVPMAPDLPLLHGTSAPAPLSAADEKTLATRARSGNVDLFREQCQPLSEPISDRAWKLDARHSLILIPCSVGRYVPDQRLFLGFLAEGEGAGAAITPLSLPYPQGDFANNVFALPGAEYSPETGKLYLFAKQGVRADCGSAGEWLWADGAFRLASFKTQSVCGGSAPQEWLTLYRSRTGLDSPTAR